MEEKLHILALLGSLRSNSFNRIVLQTAIDLCPQTANIEVADIGHLPLYNEDLESNLPSEVINFRSLVKSSDAILIVTPEYNYSIPGVLKNALDWGSRPFAENSWDGKPVALMSASTGMMGGSRAQYHLRQCFVFLNMFPVNRPEVIIGTAQEKISSGRVEDQHTKDKIVELLNALVLWTHKLKS